MSYNVVMSLLRVRLIGSLLVLALVLGLTLVPSRPGYGNANYSLSVRGTQIIDPYGQEVLLRGVNYLGLDDSPESHTEADYARFAQMGFNVVRLPIPWARLEPSPGSIDMSYISRYVSRDVEWARKYGLYVVLNIAQYRWAEKFGGGGAPEWTVQGYAPTEEGMREAVSNFWVDGYLQYRFFQVWTEIARRFVNEPSVAGYDILNEPWIYTSVIPYLDATYLDVFYLKVIKAIRTVDSNHIIFLEPANMNTFRFPLKENIVWSPHFYPLAYASVYSSNDVGRLDADLEAKYKQFVLGLGCPMWIGEFGAFMNNEKSRNDWLRDAVKVLDKYQVGWAWWAYSGGKIQPIPTSLRITSVKETSYTFTTATVQTEDWLGRLMPAALAVVFVMGLIGIYLKYRKTIRRESQ